MTKGIFSKILVSICIILTILFICAVLYLNYTNHDVDAALIYSTFAFFTSEVLAMAGIKCSKNKWDNQIDEHFGENGINTSNRNNSQPIEEDTSDQEEEISDSEDAVG